MAGQRCDADQNPLAEFASSLTGQMLADDHLTGSDAQQRRLSSLIESAIIPRLLLAHRRDEVGLDSELDELPIQVGPMDVLDFVDILTRDSYDRVQAHALALLRNGLPTKRLLLDILAPAANRLGEMWTADQLDFMEVTVGLSTLHRLVHDVCSPTLDDDGAAGPSILLAPAPGEQHVFGLLIVNELFRRAGWLVSGGVPAGPFDVVKAVRQQPFDVLGFSMSTERSSGDLRTLIADARRASRNPNMIVVIGGHLFANSPGLAASLGADFGTSKAEDAVGFASRHFARKRL